MTLYNVYHGNRLIAAGLNRPQLEQFLRYLAPTIRDEFTYKEM